MKLFEEYKTVKDYFEAGYRKITIYASDEDDVKQLIDKLAAVGYSAHYKRNNMAVDCWVVFRKQL